MRHLNVGGQADGGKDRPFGDLRATSALGFPTISLPHGVSLNRHGSPVYKTDETVNRENISKASCLPYHLFFYSIHFIETTWREEQAFGGARMPNLTLDRSSMFVFSS